MPADLNGAKTLFGGRCLSWIDEEAAIYATCQMGTHTHVTAGISAVNFENPAYEGDIVEIGTEVVKFGRTSISLRVVVRIKSTKKIICTVESIVFVALDESGKPTPHGKTKNHEISSSLIAYEGHMYEISNIEAKMDAEDGDLMLCLSEVMENSKNQSKIDPICTWNTKNNCTSCRRIISTTNPDLIHGNIHKLIL